MAAKFVRALLALSAVIFAGCGSGPPVAVELTAVARDTAGFGVLELSHTLNVVAAAANAYEIEPDLIVGGGDDNWFGRVADVAALGGGRFAVLDEMEKHVQVFDSVGRPEARIGRPGDGPGEYRQPWALTEVGGRIVVRQNEPGRAFTVFGPQGDLLATGPAEPAGDWSRPMFRWPYLEMKGFQMGAEDVSHRLLPFGDRSFLHILQENEFANVDWNSPVEYDAIPTYLIRYGLDARVRDTLAVLPGPPTRVMGVDRGATVHYSQPLWSGRPFWATGDRWYALGHGDSSHVVVHGFDGDTVLQVRWPPVREAVSERDRFDAAKWSSSDMILNSATSRRIVADEPHLLTLELDNRANNTMQFADTMATIAAAHGAGNCLFLSGVRPSDWQDGTSLTWVVINVADRELSRVIRFIPPPDAISSEYRVVRQHGMGVLAFATGHAYGMYRNVDGVFLVVRFRLPEGCST
jgi:hypothetical protein